MNTVQYTRTRRLLDRLLAAPLAMVYDHWYRTSVDELGGPCAYRECGRAGDEHLRWVGEWLMPRAHRWHRITTRMRTMANIKRRAKASSATSKE